MNCSAIIFLAVTVFVFASDADKNNHHIFKNEAIVSLVRVKRSNEDNGHSRLHQSQLYNGINNNTI